MLNELKYGNKGRDYWMEHERQHYPSYEDQWEDDSRISYELSQAQHSVPDTASGPSRDPGILGDTEGTHASRLKGHETIHGQQQLLAEDDILTTEVNIQGHTHNGRVHGIRCTNSRCASARNTPQDE